MSKFTTVIPTRGPLGNIFAITGTASSLMRQLRVPAVDIEALQARVHASKFYADACAAIREWFPLEGDEEEES